MSPPREGAREQRSPRPLFRGEGTWLGGDGGEGWPHALASTCRPFSEPSPCLRLIFIIHYGRRVIYAVGTLLARATLLPAEV